MPAAWRPTSVSDTENARVTDIGGLQPAKPFTPGDTYTVRSQRPVSDRRQLQQAGRDYPDQIESEYTQLPASTPDRVTERTERLTADADTPYETARQIERWLENNREYSLDVDRPDGNIADAFLFEMDQGYCTYYATTMVTMLRSQGIPARFVVGYTPGEQTGSNEYVVRGLDSHAWVEVYVPDIGWVQFDPTPADPRANAEQEQLDAAGVNDNSDADRAGGEETETTTTEQTTEPPANGTTPDPRNGSGIRQPRQPGSNGSATDTATATTSSDDADGGVPLPDPPSREQVLLGLVVLAGLAAGVRQTGAAQRAYRAVWLRWQPRSDPTADVERAFERVEYVLARTARPREPGETPREYLAAISADERVERVYDYYERVRYAGETSRELADRAIEMANDVVSDRVGPF